MAFEPLLWLPQTLRNAGRTVVEVAGWQTRGHGGNFTPRAAVFHHDASGVGDSPSMLQYLLDGFDSGTDSHYDAQVWVNRYGVWYLIAAGSAQHAGAGEGWGVLPADLGNQLSFGVETDHTTGELWPAAQIESLRIGFAAICAARGWDPRRAIPGHKEYAKRKPDPDGVDMNQFRASVVSGQSGGLLDMVSEPEWAEVLHAARQVNGGIGVGQLSFANTVKAILGTLQSAVNLVKSQGGQLSGGITDAKTAVLVALAAVPVADAHLAPAGVAEIRDEIQTLLRAEIPDLIPKLQGEEIEAALRHQFARAGAEPDAPAAV